jgi:hypothetical protein
LHHSATVLAKYEYTERWRHPAWNPRLFFSRRGHCCSSLLQTSQPSSSVGTTLHLISSPIHHKPELSTLQLPMGRPFRDMPLVRGYWQVFGKVLHCMLPKETCRSANDKVRGCNMFHELEIQRSRNAYQAGTSVPGCHFLETARWSPRILEQPLKAKLFSNLTLSQKHSSI